MRQHPFRRSSTSAWAGAALIIVGAYLLHDAFEGRGNPRPFLLRFLPS